MANKTTSDLNLEKFGSIGGDYFEVLVAIALDELGYVHGETYLASWDKVFVPGTWIEADFIVTPKNDNSKDPLKNCRSVFAIGHATSENSAQMKFHRDVEQLLEVKALPNGDDIMVFDVLFCCPRESMGGWSKELVSINEAIFDDSLIVWKEEWGVMLLYHMQRLSDQFSKQNDFPTKIERVKQILANEKEFRRFFDQFRSRIEDMLLIKKSKSKIQEMFLAERKYLPERKQIPLLINSQEKTEFKRGLLQVLALNEWELELLYENHKFEFHPEKYPLEQLAYDKGMSPEKFGEWWERLELLSIKIGKCWRAYPANDDILSSDEMGCFKASGELGYVFEHFDIDALKQVIANVPNIAPNLVPYRIDLQDLSRASIMCQLLNEYKDSFIELCRDCYAKNPWNGIAMPRLLVFEVAKAAIETVDKSYSYDVIANESGNQKLIKSPFTIRFLAGKKGKFETELVIAGMQGVQKRLAAIDKSKFSIETDTIISQFVYDRFDGMAKQPKDSVLDALLDAEIVTFARDINSTVTDAAIQGLSSVFNKHANTDNAGVNVEVPYILTLQNGKKIIIHRVNANEGNSGHKWKEFSSKIRSIRYLYRGNSIIESNLYCSVLVIDGNWTRSDSADPFYQIRMLTQAGWDYVVYPDGLSEAFKLLKERLKSDGLLK